MWSGVVHNLVFNDCRAHYTEYLLANHSGVIIYRLGREPVSILLFPFYLYLSTLPLGVNRAPFLKVKEIWTCYIACGNRPPNIVTTVFKLGHIVKQ